MIPTLLGVAILVFLMLRVMGGDPVEVMLRGEGANVSQEIIETERTRLGLDRPIYVQFGKWLGGMVTGDFGVSMWTGNPVSHEIASRLQLSIQVAVMATILAVLIVDSARNTVGALQGHLDRPCDPRDLDRRARGAVVLARHDHHPAAADVLPVAPADYVHAVLRESAREPVAADLAGAGGGLSLFRGGDPHDALHAARSAAGGLHPHRARQGRVRAPGGGAARAVATRCCRW